MVCSELKKKNTANITFYGGVCTWAGDIFVYLIIHYYCDSFATTGFFYIYFIERRSPKYGTKLQFLFIVALKFKKQEIVTAIGQNTVVYSQ